MGEDIGVKVVGNKLRPKALVFYYDKKTFITSIFYLNKLIKRELKFLYIKRYISKKGRPPGSKDKKIRKKRRKKKSI